ncbi:hypothetical protein CSB09_04170 [Candidatus Gracilibacteria bacterium]|nr:MAG: hypothetical protein CSB09_04170 [Candidatus Gracilibacteria bacterium]
MPIKFLTFFLLGIVFPFSLLFAEEDASTFPKLQFSPQQIWSLRGFFDGIRFQDDSDITRFVNPHYPLHDKEYKPKTVSISGAYINQAGRDSQIRSSIQPALNALAKDFYNSFGKKIVIVSAFRSFEYQQWLWDLGRCDEGAFCALPGHSEHQLGLAIDVFDPSDQNHFYTDPTYKSYIDWLKKNAHKHGWTLSYQYGHKRDGYEPEPWHWRYVGKDLATKLSHLDWNYTRLLEFYRSVGEY